MKRKLWPAFVTLLAAAVVSIETLLMGYEFQDSLLLILGTIIVFYMMTSLFTGFLDFLDTQKVKTVLDENDELEDVFSDDDSLGEDGETRIFSDEDLE